MKQRILRAIPVILVLAVGGGIAGILASARPEADKGAPEDLSLPVAVMEVNPRPERIVVSATGTVVPARRLSLMPEVSGRVIEVNGNLVPGGLVKKGEILVKIDKRDYNTALRQARARLEEARSALKIEEGRQEVARREWELFHSGEDLPNARKELALRKPYLANAKANLSSARAAVEQAKLNLERTEIEAPFDAVVQAESVEVGAMIGPQSPVATLIGSEDYWVRASVPVDHLEYINLPDREGQDGAMVRVTQKSGEGVIIERQGQIIRLLGDLDPVGRLARILIRVDDPLGLESGGQERLPLLLDAYVRAEIGGPELPAAYVIPRSAVHEGDQAWFMDQSDSLDIRELDVVWRREDDVLVVEGIEPGDRVVTSNITTPLQGQKLRVAE